MLIMQVILRISVLSQADKSPTKTELAEVAKKNIEICNITQEKPP